MPAEWYALRSKPRKEFALAQHVSSQGFELFYPRIPVRRVNPRSRPEAAYFPGYMFVRTDLAEVGMSTFTWMPNALGLVTFGGTPAIVQPALIEAIYNQIELIAHAGCELFLKINPGDQVIVTSGPFAGHEAMFDSRLNSSDRVRVLLEMLSERTIPVELHVGQIRRVA